MAVAVPSCEEGAVVPSPVTAAEAAALAVVTVGTVLPLTPLAHVLGFRPLPGPFFLFLIAAIVSYLALVEVGKHWFYRSYRALAAPAPRRRTRGHRVRRRTARFTARALRPARRADPPKGMV